MRAFLDDIRTRGELRVVAREVDPKFELAAGAEQTDYEECLACQ